MKVVERYAIKSRGWVAVVLEPSPARPPKLGSRLESEDGRAWSIVGVETHRVDDPKPPYGLATGHDGPQVGETVTLVEQAERGQ